jgi:predicted Fe-Mo cluster-binding NifX family protein
MKIVFTTKGTSWDSAMETRFGRSEYFLIYNEEKDELTHFDNRDSANDAHGAGPKTAQKLFEFSPDVLITGNGPGGNAATVLQKTGVKIYVGAGQMTVKEAFDAYKNNALQQF